MCQGTYYKFQSPYGTTNQSNTYNNPNNPNTNNLFYVESFKNPYAPMRYQPPKKPFPWSTVLIVVPLIFWIGLKIWEWIKDNL